MQGCKHVEPRLFYHISLEQLVPEDHLVRRLVSGLDLSWVRSATRASYSHTGQPSVDPEVVVKMLILGFLYNVSSERRLAEDIRVNLAYRWYLRYDLDEATPHHSVLSKARRRFGAAFFQQVFEYVVLRCRDAGLIAGDAMLIDSTTVRADASLESLTTLRYRPEEYFHALERSADAAGRPQTESGGDNDATGPDRALGRKCPRTVRAADSKRSTTDPDATLSHRVGRSNQLSYKTHVAADAAEGVITAVAVSDSATDDTAAVPDLVEDHERTLGSSPKAVVADRLYGSQDCLGYLQHKQIDTVIGERAGGNKHGGFDKSQFTYDRDRDTYTCPGGNILCRRRTDSAKAKAFYACDGQTCQHCPLRSRCVRSKNPHAARTVTRYDTPYVHRAQAICNTSRGRQLLKRRQTCIEGLFGQAKSHHGLNRARWRGLTNMSIQATLTAAVLNIKKLLKALPGFLQGSLRARLRVLGQLAGRHSQPSAVDGITFCRF